MRGAGTGAAARSSEHTRGKAQQRGSSNAFSPGSCKTVGAFWGSDAVLGPKTERSVE